MIRSCHNLLIFPRFALTPASFDKSTQATSKQNAAGSSPAGRVIAFSRAMFDHAYGYRNVYFALLNTGAWPIVRQQLQEVLEELIRRECKAEIVKLKTANSEVPVDLFVHYLTSAFFAVLIWWMDRRSRLTPSQIDEVFRSLVLPTVHAVLG